MSFISYTQASGYFQTKDLSFLTPTTKPNSLPYCPMAKKIKKVNTNHKLLFLILTNRITIKVCEDQRMYQDQLQVPNFPHKETQAVHKILPILMVTDIYSS